MPGDFAAIASRYYPIEIFDLPFEMPEQQIYMSWTDNNTSDSGHIWLREQFLRAYHNSDLTAASTAIWTKIQKHINSFDDFQIIRDSRKGSLV